MGKVASFNPMGGGSVKSSVCDHVVAQIGSGEVFTMDDAKALRAQGGAGVKVAFSVGVGRGASTMEFRGSEASSIADALAAFDPGVEIAYTPAEMIRRTIKLEEGYVCFHLSSRKHAREIRVPAGEWERFTAILGDIASYTEDAVEHFRKVVASL